MEFLVEKEKFSLWREPMPGPIKFKIGDMVTLLPWDDFDFHMCIGKTYWNSLCGTDLIINKVIPSFNHVACYEFTGKAYGWGQLYLKHSNNNPLEDELFEI